MQNQFKKNERALASERIGKPRDLSPHTTQKAKKLSEIESGFLKSSKALCPKSGANAQKPNKPGLPIRIPRPSGPGSGKTGQSHETRSPRFRQNLNLNRKQAEQASKCIRAKTDSDAAGKFGGDSKNESNFFERARSSLVRRPCRLWESKVPYISA